MAQYARKFLWDGRGATALLFSLALPVLLLSVSAGVEYGSLIKRRAELQKAADVSALIATRELGLAGATDERIQSVAAMAAASAASLSASAASVTTAVLN